MVRELRSLDLDTECLVFTFREVSYTKREKRPTAPGVHTGGRRAASPKTRFEMGSA
jgi:hypothetical protein